MRTGQKSLYFFFVRKKNESTAVHLPRTFGARRVKVNSFAGEDTIQKKGLVAGKRGLYHGQLRSEKQEEMTVAASRDALKRF